MHKRVISVFGGACECGCAASEQSSMLPSLAACDAFRRLRGVPISVPRGESRDLFLREIARQGERKAYLESRQQPMRVLFTEPATIDELMSDKSLAHIAEAYGNDGLKAQVLQDMLEVLNMQLTPSDRIDEIDDMHNLQERIFHTIYESGHHHALFILQYIFVRRRMSLVPLIRDVFGKTPSDDSLSVVTGLPILKHAYKTSTPAEKSGILQLILAFVVYSETACSVCSTQSGIPSKLTPAKSTKSTEELTQHLYTTLSRGIDGDKYRRAWLHEITNIPLREYNK